MKKCKKLITLLLCAIICFSVCLPVFASASDAKITISKHDAMPGDAVTIQINISNNPGIMAMAFCVTYDADALTFKTYSKGYLSNYTLKDHSDKGHVSFVNVENKDVATNGNILSLLFEVKQNAKPGKYDITLANSNREKYGTQLHNSFSNSKQEFVTPLIVAGSITVQETCENSGHKYGEWSIVYEADCTTTGLKKRVCTRCQNIQEAEIPITHDFESEWTIDKAATSEEDGIMSRHCTKCDEVTDTITFKYEEIDKDDTSSDNTSSDTPSNNDTSSNDVSVDNSSESNSAESSDKTNASTSDQSSQNKPAKKPAINNTVGEKVPLSEVEKFNDYQQNIKPNLNLENNIGSSDNETAKDENSSQTASDNSDVTTGIIENNTDSNTNTQDQKSSIFSTPTGIIMTIVFSILSVGIVTLGVILIMKNKKQ